MTAMQWIVGILLLISALILVVSVLLQSSESSGIGAVSGAAETFFGKNKAKGMEAKLALVTKGLSNRRFERDGGFAVFLFFRHASPGRPPRKARPPPFDTACLF